MEEKRKRGIYNVRSRKEFRRELRNQGTKAEIMLWKFLKGRQLDGFKFRRQFSIGPYIVDFYCPECRVVVELDGPSHDSEEAAKYDRRRTEYLNRLHIKVLRIQNSFTFTDIDFILEDIRKILHSRPPRLAHLLMGSPPLLYQEGMGERSL